MRSFDLRDNPFHLLGVSSRDRSDAIAEAAEEAVGSGRLAERAALAAQQTLMAARMRLDAEVGWLPGVAPARASTTVDAVIGGKALDAGSVEALRGVAKANLTAQSCTQGASDLETLRRLVACQSDIEVAGVGEAINADRFVAGFPQVDKTLVAQALKGLLTSHVEAAVSAIGASSDPPRIAANIAREFVSAQDARREFMEECVERYNTWAASRISRVGEAVVATVKAYGESGSSQDLDQAVIAMRAWRNETEARRIVFSAKKLDEPRSTELFRSVREFCKTLVNERNLPERAHEVFTALQAAFADVPSVVDQMERDIAELTDVVSTKKLAEVAGPLAAALEAANRDLDDTAIQLGQSGFSRTAKGVARQLYAGFDQAAIGLAGTEQAAIPWRAVRQLAVDLNNKADAPEEAKRLIDGLFAYGGAATPPEMQNVLCADRRKLDHLTLSSHLATAMKAGRADEALRLIALVESITDDEDERGTLRDIRTKIEAGKRAKRNKLIRWGIAAAVVLGFVILGNNQPSHPTGGTTYAPSTYSLPPVAADNSLTESMPPPSQQRILTRSELRYCLFQSTRIDDVRNLLPAQPNDYEVDAFNAMLRDWRSRCSENRYYENDKAAVDAIVAAHSALFASQAAAIVRVWQQQESRLSNSPR